MSTQPSQHHLDVPGGSVYYERRGSGSLLLVIGQPMTSGAFGPLADLLAEDHTVVTYDPHGVGESTVDDPSLAVTPEIEADDLAHIVDAIGGGKADVLVRVAARSPGWPLLPTTPRRLARLSRTSRRSRICCRTHPTYARWWTTSRTPIGLTGLARRGASSPPS
jgi:hypothetical protein